MTRVRSRRLSDFRIPPAPKMSISARGLRPAFNQANRPPFLFSASVNLLQESTLLAGEFVDRLLEVVDAQTILFQLFLRARFLTGIAFRRPLQPRTRAILFRPAIATWGCGRRLLTGIGMAGQAVGLMNFIVPPVHIDVAIDRLRKLH